MLLPLVDPIRQQYERFPYPPIPWMALPSRRQSLNLKFRGSGKPRILVVGCGTFEPLAVALQNPRAEEIVAVDCSEASLAVLRRRWRFAQVSRILPWRRWARKLTTYTVDIEGHLGALLQQAPFDYVIASNVLHHCREPRNALTSLASLLRPDGYLRLVTYPKTSRVWMRAVSRYFTTSDLSAETQDLYRRCVEAIERLPVNSPLRSTWIAQPEKGRTAGLVDAFFNARENPLSPLEWAAATQTAGLTLVEEQSDPECLSTVMHSAVPELAKLSTFENLEILDAFLGLTGSVKLLLRAGSGNDSEKPHHSTLPTEKYLERAARQTCRGSLSPFEFNDDDGKLGLRLDSLKRIDAHPPLAKEALVHALKEIRLKIDTTTPLLSAVGQNTVALVAGLKATQGTSQLPGLKYWNWFI